MATLPPSSSAAGGVLASPESEPRDFLLFDDSVYGQLQGSNFPTTQDLFHQSSMSLTDFLGDSNMNDLHHNPHAMANSMRYSQSMASELPVGSSAPEYAPFGSYSSADIPRTMSSYMTQPSNTPGVLIHPPTLPYHQFPRNVAQQVDYSHTPTGSPATSVSGFAGSEPGSVANSPLPLPLGLDDHLFNPTYVGMYTSASVPEPRLMVSSPEDPSLISHSPSEERHDPISAVSGSSFGSPNMFAIHSPAPTSNPGSPDLRRSQSGKKSPSILARYTPYPARRPSTSSLSSQKSHGSPRAARLDFDDMYTMHTDIMAPPPARSNSQGSRGSRQGRAPSSTESGDSPLGSGVGSTSGQSQGAKDGKDSVCPECSKSFRDLRAHLLTHQLERPEKCPIATCEYSKKGFARKYDCQRHTLTHYKGTMVCGFCPGSGSAMEKSFNRADVFKRHLMAVHNVEQTPPNGRKKPSKPTRHQPEPDLFSGDYVTGKCSTCALTFATAQEFYEHLDECVLSKVVEEEPAAIFNEHNLDQVNLEEVEAALAASPAHDDEDDDEMDDDDLDDVEEDDRKDGTFTMGSKGKGVASSKRTRNSKLKRGGSGKGN